MNPFTKIALGLLLSTAASQAALTYHVSIDTTSLTATSAPYSLDFQLNSGDTLGNNTATISNFVGLGALGSANTFGGVTGDLSSAVVLADTDAFNEFFQSFTAGSLIEFDLTLSQNVDSGATPDSFSVAILDSGLANVTTDGLGNSLVQFDINSSSNTLSANVGNGTGSFSGLTTTVVPEPSSALLGAAGALLAFRRRRAA